METMQNCVGYSSDFDEWRDEEQLESLEEGYEEVQPTTSYLTLPALYCTQSSMCLSETGSYLWTKDIA